jgi:hypothetical protein
MLNDEQLDKMAKILELKDSVLVVPALGIETHFEGRRGKWEKMTQSRIRWKSLGYATLARMAVTLSLLIGCAGCVSEERARPDEIARAEIYNASLAARNTDAAWLEEYARSLTEKKLGMTVESTALSNVQFVCGTLQWDVYLEKVTMHLTYFRETGYVATSRRYDR